MSWNEGDRYWEFKPAGEKQTKIGLEHVSKRKEVGDDER
jgi:hypothetical protein